MTSPYEKQAKLAELLQTEKQVFETATQKNESEFLDRLRRGEFDRVDRKFECDLKKYIYGDWDGYTYTVDETGDYVNPCREIINPNYQPRFTVPSNNTVQHAVSFAFFGKSIHDDNSYGSIIVNDRAYPFRLAGLNKFIPDYRKDGYGWCYVSSNPNRIAISSTMYNLEWLNGEPCFDNVAPFCLSGQEHGRNYMYAHGVNTSYNPEPSDNYVPYDPMNTGGQMTVVWDETVRNSILDAMQERGDLPDDTTLDGVNYINWLIDPDNRSRVHTLMFAQTISMGEPSKFTFITDPLDLQAYMAIDPEQWDYLYALDKHGNTLAIFNVLCGEYNPEFCFHEQHQANERDEPYPHNEYLIETEQIP